MKDTFNFSHNYYKFERPIFSTIRGTDACLQYKIGQIVKIKINRRLIGTAKIVNKTQSAIRDISIDFLKMDAEYPGREINSHQDFCDLLNEFRRFNKLNVNSEVSVFFLEWVERV